MLAEVPPFPIPTFETVLIVEAHYSMVRKSVCWWGCQLIGWAW